MAVLSAIALVASLATTAFSQYQGNKRGAQQRQSLKNMQNENRADLYQSQYRNSMDSPTAKGQVENARRNFEKANSQGDNKNVSGNATHQQMLASKNATNNQMGNVVNNAVANQEARQASKDERYMGREVQLNKQEQAYKGAEAQNWANTALGTGKAIANYLGTFDEGGTGNPAEPATTETAPTSTTTPDESTAIQGFNPQGGATDIANMNAKNDGIEGLGGQIVAPNTTNDVEKTEIQGAKGLTDDESASFQALDKAIYEQNMADNRDEADDKRSKYYFKPYSYQTSKRERVPNFQFYK